MSHGIEELMLDLLVQRLSKHYVMIPRDSVGTEDFLRLSPKAVKLLIATLAANPQCATNPALAGAIVVPMEFAMMGGIPEDEIIPLCQELDGNAFSPLRFKGRTEEFRGTYDQALARLGEINAEVAAAALIEKVKR